MTQSTSENHSTQREHIQKNTSPKKKRRSRRKPAVQFRLSMLVFIWLICFISCFAAYMIGQNLFPEDSGTTDSTAQSAAVMEIVD